MKRRNAIGFIIIALVLLIALIAYNYIFSIYETIYTVEPKELYADNQSTVIVKSVPLNAMGWKAPLRSSPVFYSIMEGKDLVEILEKNYDEGILRLRAKDRTGAVLIHAKTTKALLPSPVEIAIMPDVAGMFAK